jgi:hypothetical protein
VAGKVPGWTEQRVDAGPVHSRGLLDEKNCCLPLSTSINKKGRNIASYDFKLKVPFKIWKLKTLTHHKAISAFE